MKNQKPVYDRLNLRYLKAFFHIIPRILQQFLATLYDVIAEAIVADSSHSFAKENNEPATSPPKKPRRSPDLRQEDDYTKRFCMQITHSMLRTGAFSKFSAILQKVYNDIISACLTSPSSMVAQAPLLFQQGLFHYSFRGKGAREVSSAVVSHVDDSNYSYFAELSPLMPIDSRLIFSAMRVSF
ncbi:hypothetical protein ANCCAN_14966 [Ancylostoma caninum]|uniref:Uncharacterized protein n=1 Tax=Ancylostoma caninum TaxID=29170 RepID=A0A368G3U2_ANCCA|nr:hypothetical protein ANCCAN_14966 [Ancylostoma caninum]